MLADLFHRPQRGAHIADIVHGVEHAEHVHAIHRSALHKFFHHIVGVVAVTQNILAAKQHLLRRFRHGFFQFADTVPGVFAKIADARVEGRSTPGFQRPKPDLIKLGGDRQHIVYAQARGE